MRRMWVDHAGGDAESVDELDERLRRDGSGGYWEWRLAVLRERASDGEFVSPVSLAAAQAALGRRRRCTGLSGGCGSRPRPTFGVLENGRGLGCHPPIRALFPW